MKIVPTQDAALVDLPTRAARDKRLSFKALGLLSVLLSYGERADVTVDELAEERTGSAKVREGREAMRNAMNELIAAGYVVKTKTADSAGRWTTDTTVYADRSGIIPGRPIPTSQVEAGHLKRRSTISDTAGPESTEDGLAVRRSEQGERHRRRVNRTSVDPSLIVTAQAQPQKPKSKPETVAPKTEQVGSNGDRHVREAEESRPAVVAPVSGWPPGAEYLLDHF